MRRNGLGGGGNYPPGARNDPSAPYNQPDHSHDHEWREDEDAPVIEDGAAIFHERCEYAEGRHGEGWQCEKTRTYRFEYSTLETPIGEEIEIPEIGEWDKEDLTEENAAKVIEIEERFHSDDNNVSIDVDPDPEHGQVTLVHGLWKLHFRP